MSERTHRMLLWCEALFFAATYAASEAARMRRFVWERVGATRHHDKVR